MILNTDQAVDEARHGLDEALLEASQLVDAFRQVASEETPPWLFTVSRHMDRLHATVQSYMVAVGDRQSKQVEATVP